MAITTVLTKQQIRQKIGLDGVFEITEHNLLQKGEALRIELEKNAFTYLDTYSKFIPQIKKVFAKHNKTLNDFIDNSEAKHRVKLNAIIRAYNSLDQTIKLVGKQQGHLEVGVLTKQLLVLYVRLDEMVDIYEASSSRRQPRMTGTRPFDPVLDFPNREEDGYVPTATRQVSLPQLKTAVEEIHKLYVTSQAVDQLNSKEVRDLMDRGAGGLEVVRTALDKYFKNKSKHLIRKTKNVNIITGEGTQKIEFEDKDENTFKGEAAGILIGTGRNDAVNSRVNNSLLKDLADYPWTEVEGSRPLEKEIVDQIMTLASGKKPARYRSSSQKQRVVSGGKKTKLSSAIGTAILANNLAKKGLPPLVAKPKKDRGESGRGDSRSRDINKLRMKINQRLPAEVRRNMGRPALRNQTGRFSNSVTLTELRQGPKTLVGKYTYMLSPYETFENEGPRQWPTGYNPKTLITKSIRNLAMQYTEQKFTLRKE